VEASGSATWWTRPVDAVNDDADAVAELVGELLVDQAANNWRPHLLAMQAEGLGAALPAAGGERPVDGFDDVAAFSERAHGRLELIREPPHSRLGLLGQAIALQGLQAANAQRPIEVPMDLAGLGPRVQHPLLRLRLCQHGPIDAGEALGRDLGLELGPQLPIKLWAKLERRPFLGAQPNAVGDVVLRDDEVLPPVVAPANEDVAVGVTGVEVVDRNPIELGAEILLHLPHHIAGEGTQVREPITVLRSDDEAKLMAVLPAAFGEGLAVRRVGVGGIKPAALAVPRRAIALQVADVGGGCPATNLEPHDPRLDHDPAHLRIRPTLGGRPLEPIHHGLAPTNPGAPSLPGPPRAAALLFAAHLGKLQGAAVGFDRGPHDLGHEGPGIASTAPAIAYAARSRAKVEDIVVGHGQQIAPTS
jgi:hypothetical protein